jgi:hypothetical protein
MWQEAGEEWILRKLYNWYASPNIIRILKSRRMRWAGNVAHGRDEKCI